MSPNHPQRYPRSAECTYTINAPTGKRIKLTFAEFDVSGEKEESYGDCNGDKLQIFESTVKLKELCGVLPQYPYTSTNNNVLIKFKANSDNERSSGFQMIFFFIGETTYSIL